MNLFIYILKTNLWNWKPELKIKPCEWNPEPDPDRYTKKCNSNMFPLGPFNLWKFSFMVPVRTYCYRTVMSVLHAGLIKFICKFTTIHQSLDPAPDLDRVKRVRIRQNVSNLSVDPDRPDFFSYLILCSDTRGWSGLLQHGARPPRPQAAGRHPLKKTNMWTALLSTCWRPCCPTSERPCYLWYIMISQTKETCEEEKKELNSGVYWWTYPGPKHWL